MPPVTWPKLAFAQRTDAGRDPTKQVNEDAAHYAETPLGHLLVVCDGMGGHAAGREASNLAVQTIFHEVARALGAPGEALREAVAAAGRRVFAMGGTDIHAPGRPGSTCVALLMHGGGTEVAHCGDSRAYLVRRGSIWQLTRDHSMVQQLVDAGLLAPSEMLGHPDANKITRALGTTPEVDVELRHEPLLQEERDVFLLMTDGITDVVTDAELLTHANRIVDTGNVAAACDAIVALALARGGPDNATVQAAFVVDAGLSKERIAARAASQTLPGDPPVEAVGAPETRSGVRGNATLPLDLKQQRPRPTPQAPVEPPVPPARASGGREPSMAAPKRVLAPTLIDAEALPGPVSSRQSHRSVLGAALFIAGIVVVAVSLWALSTDDEAPPDVHAPKLSASARALPSR